MPQDRYYIPLPFTPGQTATIEGEEGRHLKVMRAKAGEGVELVNGAGQLAQAKLTKVERQRAEVYIDAVEEGGELQPRIILAQALPKAGRLDLILEKGTELGADAFWIFPGERSEKRRLTEIQLERAKRITIAAMKQCGRLYLPKILSMPPLKEWEEFPKCALFGDIRKGAPLLKNALPQGEEIIFFVGPEAGFTEGEVELMEKGDVQGVCLHTLILRTDTAPLAALSLLHHLTL